MDSIKKRARVAGGWYLLMALSGPIGILLVPSKVMVAGNAALTLQNLVAHELLVRVGIASGFVCQISFVFLALALSRLFEGVSEKQVKLLLAMVVASVPIAFVIELARVAALLLATGKDYATAFLPEQLQGLVMLLLKVHEQGTYTAGLFWGLWLFPFGALVLKSKYFPKFLGVLLFIGGAAYLVDGAAAILAPALKSITGMLMGPLGIGEILMVFWLLAGEVKPSRPIL